MADLEEAGELDLLDLAGNPAPLLRVGKTRSPGGLGQFAMKTLIVVGIIFGAIIFSSLLVAKKVELPVKNAIASIKGIKIGGSEFWTRLENELDRMARPENDLPEAKKKKTYRGHSCNRSKMATLFSRNPINTCQSEWFIGFDRSVTE